MSKQLKEAAIERYDGAVIQFPKKLTIPAAIQLLQRQHEMESSETTTDETIPVFPWDGAIALAKAIKELFGTVITSDKFPTIKKIAVSATETIEVPWGNFMLPGLSDAEASCAIGKTENGEQGFRIVITALYRDQPKVDELLRRTRELALSESIYRGKALDFEKGSNSLPRLTFKTFPPFKALFSKHIETTIESNILAPIWYSEAFRQAKIPLKMGILLGGVPGTGKTLVVANIAQEAVKNGWTFIEVRNPIEMPEAIEFARRMGPTVMLIEDVDRVVGSPRTDEVNKIINLVDGAGTKDMELIMLFTSNFPERIDPAMRRDGRIDVTIPMEMPDSEAVERLIRSFAGFALYPHTDLESVGELLAGSSPAKIREVVERSKREALRRTQGCIAFITDVDLLTAGRAVLHEASFFSPKHDEIHPMERVGRGVATALGSGFQRFYTEHVEKSHTNGK